MFSASRSRAEAYAATDYVARWRGRNVLIGADRRSAPAERLMARFGSRTAAFITAANPRSGLRADHANRRAEAALAAHLARLGLPFVGGWGQGRCGTWPAERSVLAFRISQRSARHVARRYGQNAIVFLRLGQPALLVHLR